MVDIFSEKSSKEELSFGRIMQIFDQVSDRLENLEDLRMKDGNLQVFSLQSDQINDKSGIKEKLFDIEVENERQMKDIMEISNTSKITSL